jgi:hypothetical protein
VSADLRTALRDAVADEPTFNVDAHAIVDAGGRRARRRTRFAVATAALSTTAVLATVAVVSRPADPDPAPAPTEVVQLDLDSADDAPLDVIAATRTRWKDGSGDEFSRHDRFEGLTTDGLVLRNRRTGPSVGSLLGLLDPRTGTTDWLPDPPANLYGMQPLALNVDRLVLGVGQGNGHSVLVFDRASRTWQRDIVQIPPGIEVHVPPLMELGTDDRAYIGAPMEGEPGPMRWWSAPVPDGGPARAEPDLEGGVVAWGAGLQLTAEPSGRVVLTDDAGPTVLADAWPAGCEPPEKFPEAPPRALLAGDVPVVSYPCDVGQMTVVYRPGEDPVAVRGASALAGDDGHVVLATATTYVGALVASDGPGSTALLDLSDLSLARIGTGPHEPQVALAAGLLLWNTPGPTDSKDVYDVVWNVARLD